MLNIVTGRVYLLEAALCAKMAQDMARDASEEIVVVPKQLTLQTEQVLMQGLGLEGSFRLQVLSPERLCGRIFDAAGRPQGERIDERGRVLLAREAVAEAEERLTLYRGAQKRRGFAQRAARQLELLRQGNLTPESLRKCAEGESGQTALKLRDLAEILDAYNIRIRNRFQDGESEFAEATARAVRAPFLRKASIWFYGFDITPPPLTRLMAVLGSLCRRATVFFPEDADPNAPDADVFEPIHKARVRFTEAAIAENCEITRERLSETGQRKPELAHLERELYAQPSRVWRDVPKDIQLAALRNPREEAYFAAALVRRLCKTRGMSYNDIAILCQTPEAYAMCLREAFHDANIPLFLSEERPASRHALSEYVLSALRIVAYQARTEDILSNLGTRYTDLSEDEADRFANYATRWGIRGRAYFAPLHRGTAEEIEVMEPLRMRFAKPIEAFRDNLREAKTFKDQLKAIFGLMQDANLYAKGLERQNKLAEIGERTLAQELSQVWNRILGVLDQMAALMGEKKVSLKELAQFFSESLDAAAVKALPQSEDAVYAQGMDRLPARPVRAVILLGLTDAAMSGEEGLLSDAQRKELARVTKAYLGSDADEQSKLREYYMKAHIGAAKEYICLCYPLGANDNSAQRPSAAINLIRTMFPKLPLRGGVQGDARLDGMLDSVPVTALRRLSARLSDGTEQKLTATLSRLGGAQTALSKLRGALDRRDAATALNPNTARQLYGALRRISVTRLENYARCPFAYFAQYGLKPELTEAFAFRPKDEGTFLHDAIRDFTELCGDNLRTTDIQTAEAAMDAVSERLLDDMQKGALGDTAVSSAQRRRLKNTARSAAEALVRHMRGSEFHPTGIEIAFGADDDIPVLLNIPQEDCVLEGRIDRLDTWEEGGYSRILDYKRGGKKFNLWEVYYGLCLQLMVYLAVAMQRGKCESAGAYYFALDEGILATQSTDAEEIQQEREKHFRLNGILPDDLDVVQAMSPDYPSVFNTRFGRNGKPYANSNVATREDFRRLTDHTLKMAKEHLYDIRRGIVEASPMEVGGKSPCDYCTWRNSCLFDATVSPERVRKCAPLTAEEVLTRLIDE